MKHLLAALLFALAGVAIAAERVPAAPTNLVSSHLPILRIQTTQSIASGLTLPCTIRVVMPTNASPLTNALVGTIRVRGASSQAYPKKSYALTLSNDVAWFGLRESRNWILNAAAVDRSFMRHKLSYDLFRSLSHPGAPRFAPSSRFVELERNNRYGGVYLLMERVDRALFNLRKFDSRATNHACIYKAVDHAANFAQPGHAGYEQRLPDPDTREYWAPLDEFNRFVSTSNDTEFHDATKGIGAKLDLENAIDFQLLLQLTSNVDGMTKNFIIARDLPRRGEPVPRFFFAPWDYDATFGRSWESSRVEHTLWLSNHLFERLHSRAEFRQRFARRWKELRAGPFSTATIHAMIDENARIIGAAAARNTVRWRTLESFPERLTFEEDVAQMKAWVTARVSWLDAEIARRAQR